MFSGLGKAWVLGQIESALKQLSREWIEKWVRCEVSLLDTYILPNTEQLKPWKSTAMQIINSITVQELQQCCNRARPELSHIFNSPEAFSKMESEIRAIRDYISRL